MTEKQNTADDYDSPWKKEMEIYGTCRNHQAYASAAVCARLSAENTIHDKIHTLCFPTIF